MDKSTSNRIWEWIGKDRIKDRKAERIEPGAGQVEIRLKAIGICGTDLHILSNHVQFSDPPLPLGHELSGEVERVGAGVRAWKQGDRVCIDPLIGCGVCEKCKGGKKHHCNDGAEIGLHLPGGWQTFLIVPESNLYSICDSITFEEATQAETLHCCVGGVEKLEIRLGMKAAIVGDGPTGLFYLQLMKAMGSNVTLVGNRDDRLKLGESLGADNIVHANDKMPSETFDIVIEAAGTEDSVRQSITLLKKGGQMLLFGLPSRSIPVDIQEIVMKELRVYGSTNAPDVWPRVIEFISSGSIKVLPLITHTFSFEELDEALSFTREQQPGTVKVVIKI